MKERPISLITGKESQRGKRLKSIDGLSWKQRNREAVNARTRLLYASNPAKHRAAAIAYKRGPAKSSVLETNRAWHAAYRARLRAEMLVAYGGRCACCGESEPVFLQLDHVHNDGHLDRKAHKTSTKLFAVLRRQNWPRERYQLLCANCNFGKLLNRGVCPHKTNEAKHG